MKIEETEIKVGGVFRCCHESIPQQFEPGDEVQPGDRVLCEHCGQGFELIINLWVPMWQIG